MVTDSQKTIPDSASLALFPNGKSNAGVLSSLSKLMDCNTSAPDSLRRISLFRSLSGVTGFNQLNSPLQNLPIVLGQPLGGTLSPWFYEVIPRTSFILYRPAGFPTRNAAAARAPRAYESLFVARTFSEKLSPSSPKRIVCSPGLSPERTA
jgi:hypothetical protein